MASVRGMASDREEHDLKYRDHGPEQEETQPWAVENSFSPAALGTVSAK